MEFLGASSGLSEHDLTRVKPNKTASRTDEFHHVEHIGAGTAANVEDCRSRDGAKAIRCSMSRLLAWIAGGFCASSMNRMKKSGSLVRSTCVKRLVWGWVLKPILCFHHNNQSERPLCYCLRSSSVS